MSLSAIPPSMDDGKNTDSPISKKAEKMASAKSSLQQRNYIPIARSPYKPLNQSSYLSPPSAAFDPAVLPEKISIVIQGLETEQQQKNAKEILLKTRTFHLPRPLEFSPDQQMVILWRGCGERQLLRAALYGCFSTMPNEEALPPSEKESREQVGEKTSLPEFTSFPDIAEGFGTNKFVAAFAIKTRYLSKGSPSEGGFICTKDAPVTLVGWKEGRKILPESVEMQAASKRRQLARESSLVISKSSSTQSPEVAVEA